MISSEQSIEQTNCSEEGLLMKFKSLAMLAALFALVGCTLPNKPIPTPTPVATNITGNWEITLPATNQAPTPFFGIYLTQSDSTVSGIARVQMVFPLACMASGPPCGLPFEGLNPNLTGTIDAYGNIVLTSTSSVFSPEIFTITANILDDSTLSGIYTATSGGYTDQGAISGTMIAPLNGTYIGTLVSSVTGNSVGVSTTLNQSGPVSGSYLQYSGSASFTGVSCIGSVTVPASGNFFGDQLNIELLPANIPHSEIYLTGTISPDAKTIAVNYVSVSSSCSADFASGTLTLQ
jgi:hypothetical protein